jgi:hypothetical protein
MRILVLTIALSLVALPAFAQAVGSTYVEGWIGTIEPADRDFRTGGDLTYDTGGALDGRLGFQATDVYAIAADVAAGSLGIDRFDSLDDSLDILRISLGAYATLLSTPVFDAYIGGGLGLAREPVEANAGYGDDTNLTAHAEAGLPFASTDGVAIVPAYRLQWVDGIGDDAEVGNAFTIGARVAF